LLRTVSPFDYDLGTLRRCTDKNFKVAPFS
jgi:hypothetical protein